MAREIEPFVTEPKKALDAEFNTLVKTIRNEKKKIATHTENKNDAEAKLIEDFIGVKKKGSVTVTHDGDKVKVEFKRTPKPNIVAIAEAIPESVLDLVFPKTREFSASGLNAYIKSVESDASKAAELQQVKDALDKHIDWQANKPSVSID